LFVKILLNYILGYVNIKVESYFIERFVNMCISKKIFLWNIKRKKSTILYANVGIKDYKKLKQVIKKTQSKISIETKKGIPFIMHRYRKRKIFVILLVFVIIGLIIISNFVWNIEIEGNDKVTKEEIIQELNKDGLTIGIPKTKINTNLIINKFRLDRNDIAWIGIDIKGTNVIVKS
jgi:similar to stage IV sporulation protein